MSQTAMEDDLLTNFVAAAPAPLSRSAERTKLKRLQRHKGLVRLLTRASTHGLNPRHGMDADTMHECSLLPITVACCAEEGCCSEAWQADGSAAASPEWA